MVRAIYAGWQQHALGSADCRPFKVTTIFRTIALECPVRTTISLGSFMLY
jgi:hypothetical protein